MPGWMIEVMGWVPGIVFPLASFFQLRSIRLAPSCEGVSMATWCLFCLANLGMYGYLEKYRSPQALALLLTALLQLLIVLELAMRRQRRSSPEPVSGEASSTITE